MNPSGFRDVLNRVESNKKEESFYEHPDLGTYRLDQIVYVREEYIEAGKPFWQGDSEVMKSRWNVGKVIAAHPKYLVIKYLSVHREDVTIYESWNVKPQV